MRLPEEGESDRFGNLGDAFVGGEKETLRLAETHRTEKIREGRVHSAAEDAGEIRRGNADGGGDLSFGQDGIVFFDTGDGTAQDLPLPPDVERGKACRIFFLPATQDEEDDRRDLCPQGKFVAERLCEELFFQPCERCFADSRQRKGCAAPAYFP